MAKSNGLLVLGFLGIGALVYAISRRKIEPFAKLPTRAEIYAKEGFVRVTTWPAEVEAKRLALLKSHPSTTAERFDPWLLDRVWNGKLQTVNVYKRGTNV